jgi:hypothetical protein
MQCSVWEYYNQWDFGVKELIDASGSRGEETQVRFESEDDRVRKTWTQNIEKYKFSSNGLWTKLKKLIIKLSFKLFASWFGLLSVLTTQSNWIYWAVKSNIFKHSIENRVKLFLSWICWKLIKGILLHYCPHDWVIKNNTKTLFITKFIYNIQI